MGGLDKLIDGLQWPDMLGTPFQGATVLLLIVVIIRTSPAWLTTWSALRMAKSNANADRIRTLEQAVADCRADCDRETKALREEIHGIREQRTAEQLALMRAVVRMSGDPEVKRQLHLLEAMEAGLQKVQTNRDAENKEHPDA